MGLLTIKQVADALVQASDYFNWEHEWLEDYHEYAHRFGGSAGGNVLQFLLQDALKLRGLTLEQFREGRNK